MKKYLVLVSFLFIFFGCDHSPQQKKSEDFKTLMGLNKTVWKFVETQEDLSNIQLFQSLYEKNRSNNSEQDPEVRIPNVIHFIWIGPNPFPKESIENVKSWIDLHPDWTVKFWTDRKRALPDKRVQVNFVSDFSFSRLKACFDDSNNYAEKSDLLRYEILMQEGGLYVDHDVKCFKPFGQFHCNYDLFCGLEPPHTPILSSSISVCNNIIGAKPRHPVLKKCMDLVLDRWVAIGSSYPGDDKESIIYRVANRTFDPFDEATRILAGNDERNDIVFPAGYFNQIDNDFGIFAHHKYASSWYEDETKFERNTRRRLVSISKKNNQILLFNGVILIGNLALFACLLFQHRAIRALQKKK